MLKALNRYQRAALSHGIWMNQVEKGPIYSVSIDPVDAAKAGVLPRPAQQLDLYILYIGDTQNGMAGNQVEYTCQNLRAKIGAVTKADVYAIETYARDEDLITNQESMNQSEVTLTLKGWEYYEEIKRGRTSSKTAFMAMSFGNSAVAKMVNDVFRLAVANTGFILKRLDDQTPAGLIDNRMRVEIRNCRFLIADLTDGNFGAYWEAGFAEGLGRPVIFTCEKKYFDDPKTHFDTNHHHTVIWDKAHPEKAAEDLNSTIRATLPFEAKMEDE
jgi:hypothetical protein